MATRKVVKTWDKNSCVCLLETYFPPSNRKCPVSTCSPERSNTNSWVCLIKRGRSRFHSLKASCSFNLGHQIESYPAHPLLLVSWLHFCTFSDKFSSHVKPLQWSLLEKPTSLKPWSISHWTRCCLLNHHGKGSLCDWCWVGELVNHH